LCSAVVLLSRHFCIKLTLCEAGSSGQASRQPDYSSATRNAFICTVDQTPLNKLHVVTDFNSSYVDKNVTSSTEKRSFGF